MISTVVWTLIFLAFSGLFVWQMWGRWQLIRQARSDDGRSYGNASWAERFRNLFFYGFLQKKFFRGDQPAGFMHVIVFWGFLVLLFQVIHMFVRGWCHEFYLPGLTAGTLLGPYTLVKDIFEVGVIVGAGIALYRWLVSKPERLMGILPAEKRLRSQSHWEAVLILIFIMGIMLSGLFYDAGRYVFLSDPETLTEYRWGVVSAAISGWFGGNAELAQCVSQIAWWVHNGIILLFINLLPRSKHFHIITALPNVFLSKVEPRGKLPKKNYESEEALFGRSQINHFTKKQVLDMFSCTECGRCSSVCPAAATGKPLAPRQMLLDLRDNLYQNQSVLSKATANGAPAEMGVIVGENKAVIDEVIWSCVACRACEEACPVNIEYVDKIVDIRQHLVQEAARFPAELNRAFKGLETQSNPWGISKDERAAWAEGLDVPTIHEKPDAEYLYYVGCGGSFDANNKKATQSFVKVLKSGGIDFAILGKDEVCNGETARRLGNEYLYQMMTEQLVATINAAKTNKIIVNCPHCFNTLKNEYPDFGGNWEVIHAAKLVSQLVDEGKVKLQCPSKKKVVYHDSCYYGRFNDIYDEPRNLINQIPEVNLDEINPCKDKGTCCGAGGGRMWVEEEKDQRVNIMRTEQALEKDPEVIATSCPFCKIMISSAINEKGLEEKVEVLDVMEMVDRAHQ